MPDQHRRLRKQLAQQVRACRKARGWSQEKLALEADVDRTYVSQIEREVGNPSLAVIVRLADALNCRVDIGFAP